MRLGAVDASMDGGVVTNDGMGCSKRKRGEEMIYVARKSADS